MYPSVLAVPSKSTDQQLSYKSYQSNHTSFHCNPEGEHVRLSFLLYFSNRFSFLGRDAEVDNGCGLTLRERWGLWSLGTHLLWLFPKVFLRVQKKSRFIHFR